MQVRRRTPHVITALVALVVAGVVVSAWIRQSPAPATPTAQPEILRLADDPSRHLSIAWQGSPFAEGGQSGSWIERRIEERYNVSLSAEFIPFFSYDKTLRFRLMGGQVPDIFWVRNAREARSMVNQGFALEVPYAVIARFAPHYMAQVSQHTPSAWLITHYHGKNIGLPTYNFSTAVRPQNGIWNKTWLDRVGITRIPETLAEFETALRKLHTDDPDRNGRTDTWGMLTTKPGFGVIDASFQEIFGAYGITSTGWIERQGKLIWGGITPEAREVLALLRRWYAEGLIHPDYVVLPAGNLELRNQLNKGSIGYMLAWGYGTVNLAEPTSIHSIFKTIHPDQELVSAWLPQGPHGRRGARAFGGYSGSLMMFGPQLARHPEKLIRILRILDDAARDDATYLELRIGREGVHWKWNDTLGLRKVPPYDNRALMARELLGQNPGFDIGTDEGYFIPFSARRELVDRYTIPAVHAYKQTYNRLEWGLTDALGASDVLPSAPKHLQRMGEVQAGVFSAIITGKAPLDSFDDFVEQWRQLGGDLLTAEANELFKQKAAILQRIEEARVQYQP